MTALKFVERLRDLAGGVDVLLSDIWGVVHNGLVAFPEACEALHNFRNQGGTVILITNAPRPADSVQRQLRKLLAEFRRRPSRPEDVLGRSRARQFDLSWPRSGARAARRG
jgi:hypothetical protein